MCLTSEIDFDMNDGKLVFEFLMNQERKTRPAGEFEGCAGKMLRSAGFLS
jgi:hypothetical protein